MHNESKVPTNPSHIIKLSTLQKRNLGIVSHCLIIMVFNFLIFIIFFFAYMSGNFSKKMYTLNVSFNFSAANPHGVRTVEVCQKAFMHVYAITEKRVRLQREKLICQYGITPQTRPECPSGTPSRTQDQEPVSEPIDLRRKRDPPPMIPISLKAPDKDIALVHNFFLNQLWKPEYIGTAT